MTDVKEIQNMLYLALDTVYQKDAYLIHNSNDTEDNHVSERGIVFRYGIYLDEVVRSEFPLLNVDTEYNRNRNDLKRLPNRKHGSYPDLILHERGAKNNLLVIEFKTWWDSNQKEDKSKIEAFCDPSGEYSYKYGVVIMFGKRREEATVNIFSENTWEEMN